jgi:hypothetical protein
MQGIADWFDWPAWQRALLLLGWVLGAVLVYFGGLYLAGFRLAQFRAEHPGKE